MGMNSRLSIILTVILLAAGACSEEPKDGGVEIARMDKKRLILPPVSGNADPALPLVVIDPGHGGRDPGAVSENGGGVVEKDVTLEIARAIETALRESGQVRIALTRSEDIHVPLEARPEIARRLRASLFISVHADAAQRESARGASLYTLSEVASDREAAALAERENASATASTSHAAGDAVAPILFDLAQRESMIDADQFARLLHREGSSLLTFQPDHRRFASLVVLKAPDMPSLLFETGYLTNEEDAAFLRSEEGKRRIAASVRKAVEAHFARRRFHPAAASARAIVQ